MTTNQLSKATAMFCAVAISSSSLATLSGNITLYEINDLPPIFYPRAHIEYLELSLGINGVLNRVEANLTCWTYLTPGVYNPTTGGVYTFYLKLNGTNVMMPLSNKIPLAKTTTPNVIIDQIITESMCNMGSNDVDFYVEYSGPWTAMGYDNFHITLNVVRS